LMKTKYTIDEIKAKAVEFGITNSTQITDQTVFGCMKNSSYVGWSFSIGQTVASNISCTFPVATYTIPE